MQDQQDLGAARALCLRYLSRRDYSRLELSRRMKAKGFAGAIVDQVLDQLMASGDQSDRRCAESLVRRRAQQGYGLHRIHAELRQLGVEREAVGGADCDWDAVLETVYRKKYGSGQPASARELASRHRFLLQRGFSAGQIQRVLQRLGVRHDPSD